MSTIRRLSAVLGAGLWIGSGAIAHSQETSVAAGVTLPKFGTQSETTTVIAGSKFYGEFNGFDPGTFSIMFGICGSEDCSGGIAQVRAAVNVPSGALVTSIGVNTATTNDVPLNFSLYSRDDLGNTAELGSASIPIHAGFATDHFTINDVLAPTNSGHVLVIVVRSQYAFGVTQSLGYVEVAWRLTVSEPPETPRFGDVPVTHPFFQFIEALAASGITGGCGPGTYCPEAPLTRGQMAVFLSKALGLHWPQ